MLSLHTRLAGLIERALLPLALVAVALALIVPSRPVAARGDLILGLLVLLTALGIAPAQLWDLRMRWRWCLALAGGPFVVLIPLAWLLSRAFDGPVRDGVLTLGLSSTEVAAVGLVALAGGDAALALGALAGSLVVAATAGPLLIGFLAGGGGGGDPWSLLGRFALVVLLPLLAGVGTRSLTPRSARAEPWFAAGSTLTVVVLIYAALSGAAAGSDLGPALAGSAAFLLLAALPGLAAARVVAPRQQAAVGFAVTLRDFAVAAALATSAFGPRAGTVAGLYGVLMLITGAVATAAIQRRDAGRPPARPPSSG